MQIIFNKVGQLVKKFKLIISQQKCHHLVFLKQVRIVKNQRDLKFKKMKTEIILLTSSAFYFKREINKDTF